MGDVLSGTRECPQEPSSVEIASRLRCLADIGQDASDGWTRLNPSARELIRQASTEIDRLEKVADAGMGVIASLAAAISLLERTSKAKKAAPSDRMFDLMLDDYRKALEDARERVLGSGRNLADATPSSGPGSSPSGADHG